MALTLFAGTVTAAQLRANFDDKTPTLAANALVGQKDHGVGDQAATLQASTALVARSILFTPQDDCELRWLHHRASADAINRTLTTTLSVANGDALFLVNNSISIVTVSPGAGFFDGRQNFTTTTGTRVRLLKGVEYQLAISVDAGLLTSAQFQAILRTVRRRA